MTTDPIEQLMQGLRDARLSDEERSAMRRSLLSFAHARPPRSPMVAFFARHAMGYAFAALILMTGSTAALADRSLPGDFLYTVKTSVNDQVAVVVAGDEESRIQKELDQIARSLDEEEDAAEIEQDQLIEQEGEPTSIEFHDDAESDLDAVDQILLEDDGSAELEKSL